VPLLLPCTWILPQHLHAPSAHRAAGGALPRFSCYGYSGTCVTWNSPVCGAFFHSYYHRAARRTTACTHAISLFSPLLVGAYTTSASTTTLLFVLPFILLAYHHLLPVLSSFLTCLPATHYLLNLRSLLTGCTAMPATATCTAPACCHACHAFRCRYLPISSLASRYAPQPAPGRTWRTNTCRTNHLSAACRAPDACAGLHRAGSCHTCRLPPAAACLGFYLQDCLPPQEHTSIRCSGYLPACWVPPCRYRSFLSLLPILPACACYLPACLTAGSFYSFSLLFSC